MPAFPKRTARTIARAHGAKVPPLPASDGYCALHGHPHMSGAPCVPAKDNAAVAEDGGKAKLPSMTPPFKLGGG